MKRTGNTFCPSLGDRRDRLLNERRCQDKTLSIAVRYALAEAALDAQRRDHVEAIRSVHARLEAARSSVGYRVMSWFMSGPNAPPPAKGLWRWLRKSKPNKPVGIAGLSLSDLKPDAGEDS